MKMTGQSYWFEESARITGAVVTPRKVSVDFVDDTGEGHFDAESADHVTYTGTFSYRHDRDDSHRHVRFDLFESADGQVLLVGKWWNTAIDDSGDWLIRLERTPEDE